MYMKRFKTLACVLAMLAVSVGLSGCQKVISKVTDTEQTQMITDVEIGVVVAQTGRHVQPYGLPMLRGFEMARDEINRQSAINLTFITADDKSTVEGAKDAVQALVDQGVPAIVGVAISTQLKYAFPIAQENGVVAFSPVSSAPGLSAIGDYIFRTSLASDILIPNGVITTQEKLGYKKVAAIYDGIDVYAARTHAEIKKALDANNVELITVETFKTGDTDFTQQLTHIMNMNPDALFISGLTQEVIQLIVQARAIGIPNTVDFIISQLTQADIQQAGAAAEGTINFSVWSPKSQTPGNQDFVAKYQQKYGIAPGSWAAQSYATLHILVNAIATAGTTDSDSIRDALALTTDFPTILGNFSFDSNGEAVYTPIVLVVTNGELQVFE